MEIRRNILTKLFDWKLSPKRKPLIIQGVRQVGKTWILKKFGESYFEGVAYFNFEKQVDLRQFFSKTKEPERIIQNLAMIYGRPILSERTLIIFDEIQECNDALNSLKYFAEEAPGYCIACAGSLLGVALSRGTSFPVGKVDFLNMYPVSFSEFLQVAEPTLFTYIDNLDKVEAIPDIFFNPLTEKLKMYFISGGMPEAVVALLEMKDVNFTQQVLQNILNAYSLDFSKHIANKDIQKINLVWTSLPSQLARENKKFLYQTLKSGARAREYEDALNWLINAGMVYKIYCSSKPGLPISAYDDLSSFKIYTPDVGLLRRLSRLDPLIYGEGNRLFSEFKGALTENFVLDSIVQQFENLPRYWNSGNMAEIDFLVQYHNHIIPVEVKSDENIKSKSLATFMKHFHPELSVRLSMRNFQIDNGLMNMPLFLVDYLRKFIDQIEIPPSTLNTAPLI